jgi:hypothetical protein
MPVELRFLEIPTRWTVRVDKRSGERCLVPAVNQHPERRFARVAEPEEIRKQFFRLKFDEQSALDFLNGVGVWSAIDDPNQHEGPNGCLLSGNASVGLREMVLLGSFGHRWFNGRASIETVESLKQEQVHWRNLLRNRTKLKAAFGPGPSADSRPYDKDRFALESKFGNTLEVHLEWRGKVPYFVIQPVTGRELLIALAWMDLVTGAQCKVCQNPKCGIEYSLGGRKFCSWQCEHANTMRNYRKRRRGNPD